MHSVTATSNIVPQSRRIGGENFTDSYSGFVKLKKNQKIREKLGSGWVGQVPTRILLFFWKFCIFFLCVLFFHVSKCFKKKNG